ncbi:acid protease [Auriscalpium vulgare]|uniref:Acid protease n=1 Tax=Auriscalpium vulgare TaxID=40419 RepID=A0ACB8RI54_9AGAM|nr:acid protease [Auriscalpium vulgare]
MSSVAVRLDLHSQRSTDLFKRSNTSAHAATLITSEFEYKINITLGGQPFTVQLDSGSADLWVVGTVSNANLTGYNATDSYLDGTVTTGPVKTAVLELAGFTVPDQAFMEVSPSANQLEGSGLIGIGPYNTSTILDALGGQLKGAPPLDRIFGQNISTSNYFTVFSNRLNDTEETTPGTFTIEEVISGYDNIFEQPKIGVTSYPPEKDGSSWQGLLDVNGIIGPNGKPLNVSSSISGNPDKRRLVAVFDTGTTNTYVLPSVAKQIYSVIDGAMFMLSPVPQWLVPCEAEVNVTFKFGGQSYPMHPLDLSRELDSDLDLCAGIFQPSLELAPEYDLLLGDAFLKSVYMLINAGDFVDGSPEGPNITASAAPYVQLLAITDPAKAHLEFVAARLNGSDTTGNQTFNPVPDAFIFGFEEPPVSTDPPASTYPDTPHTNQQAPDPPASTYPDTPHTNQQAPGSAALLSGAAASAAHQQDCFFERHKTAIIVVGAVGGVLLLLLLAAGIFAAVKWRQAARSEGARPARVYRPLDDPAPAGEGEKVAGYSDL